MGSILQFNNKQGKKISVGTLYEKVSAIMRTEKVTVRSDHGSPAVKGQGNPYMGFQKLLPRKDADTRQEIYHTLRKENGKWVCPTPIVYKFKFHADQFELRARVLGAAARQSFCEDHGCDIPDKYIILALRFTLKQEGQCDYSGINWPGIPKAQRQLFSEKTKSRRNVVVPLSSLCTRL